MTLEFSRRPWAQALVLTGRGPFAFKSSGAGRSLHRQCRNVARAVAPRHPAGYVVAFMAKRGLQYGRRTGCGYRIGERIRFRQLPACMPSPTGRREPCLRGICAVAADFHIMEKELPFFGIQTRMHIR